MFYYTNFIVETNVWWLRRIRPIWMGACTIMGLFYLYRYYFFGKWAAVNSRALTPQQHQERAEFNKRNYGYNSFYKPTYEKSRKKQIMEVMGSDYDYAFKFEDRHLVLRNCDELDRRI